MKTADAKVQLVTTERLKEIVEVTDLATCAGDLRPSYDAMMLAWLLDDRRPLSWERVVMVSDFVLSFNSKP